MIKFTALIHKETGTVIKYEDWKERLGSDMPVVFINPLEEEPFNYSTKEMIFSDDFEIVYDSEFTTEELIEISEDREGLDLEVKISELIGEREYINKKYGIEV